jgi:hypothetical protein
VENASVIVPGPGDYFPTLLTQNGSIFLWILPLATKIPPKRLALVPTVTFNQQVYSVFQGDFFGYVYRKANGNYYRYGPVDVVGLIDSTESAKDFIFLKDNVPSGSTWNHPL